MKLVDFLALEAWALVRAGSSPVARTINNLQYLTAEENLKKGNKMPEEFGDMAKLVETRQT